VGIRHHWREGPVTHGQGEKEGGLGWVGHAGPFLTSTLTPRGEICPLGDMFTPLFTLWGLHSLLFRRMEGQTENFTPRG
jgi:hypothetical protein